MDHIKGVPADMRENLEAVEKEIAAVLNKHGMDAAFGTPDFLLARFAVCSILVYGGIKTETEELAKQ